MKFKNPWWTYYLDGYQMPSGKGGEYHYVHTNGSAMVVPCDEDGRVLLVNQYRYLIDRESLEFPCGSVKDGATYDQTAWHELAEETGYSAQILLLAGEFNPYNGITDEMCRVYIARELRYVGENPDETEEFELVALPPAEIDAKIMDGTIWDGMTIAAWGIVRDRLEAKKQ
jgi:8-oxo-dGTP pyrophosphatase MutT (NUDIX family)